MTHLDLPSLEALLAAVTAPQPSALHTMQVRREIEQAAVSALPALLAIARAARAWRDEDMRYAERCDYQDRDAKLRAVLDAAFPSPQERRGE